ncbi:uncharacterized protein MKK02DRAFT_29562 [Dioszegia hungarica]|uniref:Uncharacterized protein n=1 Tax=Dioszegia hungarica TaxID=4972 RepID=A0AA38HF44_9TREE|nr:uncharacterized protein MKK02DRAFT_29562 [Dioszegia hungarica]KAI9639520.1 hypothetical protein MKK02DRAFT_29562 [Dioszegia hungarica]
MWWYRNTTENAHSHLLNHSANAFWGAPTDGNRWSDERNRELTAHLDPAYVKRLSNSPRPITLKMDEPARPLPIVGMQDHTRLTLQRKRATRMGNVAVNPENEANWKRLGLEKCWKNRMLAPTGPPCDRPQFEDSAFCDYHSCKLATPDGYRCPNLVDNPAISRSCSSGYHAETDRDAELDAYVEKRKAAIAIEVAIKAKADAQQELDLRMPLITEYQRSPEFRQMSLESGDEADNPETPPTAQPARLAEDVRVWWRGTSTGNSAELMYPLPIPIRSSKPVAEPVPASESTYASLDSIAVDFGLGLTINADGPGVGVNVGVSAVNGNTYRQLGAGGDEQSAETEEDISQSLDTGMRRQFPHIDAPATTSQPARRSASEPRRLSLGSGSRMARIMTERFGNGYVRRQAFGHASSSDSA